MQFGHFVGDGWDSGPVAKATAYLDRWQGLRPRSRGFGLWLKGSSVHSFGMKEGLIVIGLTRNLTVAGMTKLQPGRVVFLREARSILELPLDREYPSVGLALDWLDARQESVARPADPLRHPDRKPG